MGRSARWALALFAITFALRVGVCAAKGKLGRSPERGYREYVVAGQRLLEHGTIVSPLIVEDVDRTPSSLLPPAYVGLVAVAYWLLGVETFAATLALQIINALASSLCAVVAYRVTGALLDLRSARLAGLIAAINPTLIGYTDFIWDTYLFALGVIVTAWLALALARTRRWIGWFGFGLWLGALALLNPALTAAYPLFVLWPIARRGHWNWGSAARYVSLAVAGWLVAIAPWTVRNYVHFGELVYVRSGIPLQLWLGSCAEADPGGADAFKSQFPLNNEAVQRHVSQVGERAFVRECGERAKEAIRENPWRFVRLCAIRGLDYWAGTTFSHAALGPDATVAQVQRRVITCFLAVESAVIVIGLALRRRLGPDLPWLLGAAVTFSIVYCLTHVQVRFRAPMEPVMAVLIAMVVVRVCDRWLGRGEARGYNAPA